MNNPIRRISISLLITAAIMSPQLKADVLFSEDFEDGDAAGWTLNGNIVVNHLQAIGQYSLRHKKSGTSVIGVPTTGKIDVSVTMHLAATSLEKNDDCYAEVSADGGGSCGVTIRFAPVVEAFQFDSLAIPSNDPDEPLVQVTFSGTGTEPGGGTDPDFDPLNGSGDVNRSALNYNTLISSSDPGSRVDLSAYGVPADAAHPVSFVIGTDGVMKGWNEGVLGMKPGGKRMLLVPPGMAYGAREIEGVAPENASLMFRIELLKLEAPPGS
jgi:hypothetical protein